jgi:hypothetical protein
MIPFVIDSALLSNNTEKNYSGPLLKNFQEADSSEFVKEISGIGIP